jgi:ABC-2 type transport system ATP-binding protein
MTATADAAVPGLEARDLTKRYGDFTALDRLNLTVNRGEIVCLLGANGAGKTTTINLFLNFTEPSGGSARVAGIDVVREPLESKKHLAYIPELVMLYRNLSGIENLGYFASLATGRSFKREELVGYLQQAGLDADFVDRRVEGYSKGMRQKVGIALALARNASTLLLDEPTSGLDPKASNEFSELLLMFRSRGASILMATHDLFRAKETCDRIGIMKHGRLMQTLSAAEVDHAELERIYLDHMRD